MMKRSGKFMSACALLVMTTACYASQETEVVKPSLVGFHIKNDSGQTIYGSIYKTTAGGSLVGEVNDETYFFKVQDLECFSQAIDRSSKRTSEFHRIIFSTSPYALRKKLENNVGNPKVVSTLIPQNIFSNMFTKEKSPYCYKISRSGSKLRIKRTGSGANCSACAEPVVNFNSRGDQRGQVNKAEPSAEDLEYEQTKQSLLRKIRGSIKPKPKPGTVIVQPLNPSVDVTPIVSEHTTPERGRFQTKKNQDRLGAQLEKLRLAPEPETETEMD